MTRLEHLLVILMEECDEVSQRASKALRFGLNEVQPDQEKSNQLRLELELVDLFAVVEMLQQMDYLDDDVFNNFAGTKRKMEKVEKFLRYSVKCGTLAPIEEGTK